MRRRAPRAAGSARAAGALCCAVPECLEELIRCARPRAPTNIARPGAHVTRMAAALCSRWRAARGLVSGCRPFAADAAVRTSRTTLPLAARLGVQKPSRHVSARRVVLAARRTSELPAVCPTQARPRVLWAAEAAGAVLFVATCAIRTHRVLAPWLRAAVRWGRPPRCARERRPQLRRARTRLARGAGCRQRSGMAGPRTDLRCDPRVVVGATPVAIAARFQTRRAGGPRRDGRRSYRSFPDKR